MRTLLTESEIDKSRIDFTPNGIEKLTDKSRIDISPNEIEKRTLDVQNGFQPPKKRLGRPPKHKKVGMKQVALPFKQPLNDTNGELYHNSLSNTRRNSVSSLAISLNNEQPGEFPSLQNEVGSYMVFKFFPFLLILSSTG